MAAKEIINNVGSAIHVVMPMIVVGAAIYFHAIGHPFTIATLIVLVSAAYGKTIWHDFLQSKIVTATKSITETVTKTFTGKVEARDADRGVQPTP